MSNINSELISILKQKTPPGENAVNILTDIIPLSKEAAYRRLRGDIPLSLEEAVRICQKFNISLDLLMNVQQANKYSFNLHALFETDGIENYYLMMKQSLDKLSETVKDPTINAQYTFVRNIMPELFVFKYDSIIKIFLFRWLYQIIPGHFPQKMIDIKPPQKLIEVMRQFSVMSQRISASLIIDSVAFTDFIRDITYWRELNMVSEEEISQLKKDVLAALKEMEMAASEGKFKSGYPFTLYVSHILIDSSYTLFKIPDYEVCSVNIYGLNCLTCTNPKVLANQEVWMDYLIRNSTLVSKSGKLTRIEYFAKQREIIEAL